MRQRRTSGEMTQEEFEMRAAYLVALKERFDFLKGEMNRLRSGMALVVCETLDDARRFHTLQAESKACEEEMRDVASEMEAGGVPYQVWILYRRSDGPNMRIQIRECAGNGRPYASVERAR